MINQKRALDGSHLQKLLRPTSASKRFIHVGLVGANVVILVVITALVIHGSHHNSLSAVSTLSEGAAANPVDGLTAYDIAANVAHVVNLPESIPIDNQAQSAHAEMTAGASDTSVIAKPQVVSTALKSRADIQSYTVQAGDTAVSIAQKFGITTDSIMWSNGITGVAVSSNTKLVIPPINGIVYTVRAGDTVQNLAIKFSANATEIVAYNDAEISGIQPGEQILIPDGKITAPQANSATYAGDDTSSAGGSFTPLYGNNGYDYGYCTWYVASQISVPRNWGNATSWAYYAALSGWSVSFTPSVGSIAQTSAVYEGHVAIVTAVNGNNVTISEMNATAGWGKVDTRTVPATKFQHYISR